jgi:hypothetical protein
MDFEENGAIAPLEAKSDRNFATCSYLPSNQVRFDSGKLKNPWRL